jgi:hypothetical protein
MKNVYIVLLGKPKGENHLGDITFTQDGGKWLSVQSRDKHS